MYMTQTFENLDEMRSFIKLNPYAKIKKIQRRKHKIKLLCKTAAR